MKVINLTTKEDPLTFLWDIDFEGDDQDYVYAYRAALYIDGACAWETGKVIGDERTAAYSGMDYSPFDHVLWTVSVWNQYDKVADTAAMYLKS